VEERPLRILIVDDHAAIRRLVKTTLELAGWECSECQDGQEALEQYEQMQPDLVLMDLSMEHLDGIGATTRIKARFPAARILILTEYDNPQLRMAALQAGACGYVLKENLLGLQNAIRAQIATPVHGSGSIPNGACFG
jgi:CheY-like chemotaxis protein